MRGIGWAEGGVVVVGEIVASVGCERVKEVSLGWGLG